MSEYTSLLSSLKMEIDSPYNDGYSQLAYKDQYENLVKLGEKEFTRKSLRLKVEEIENKIEDLTFELDRVKSKLSELN